MLDISQMREYGETDPKDVPLSFEFNVRYTSGRKEDTRIKFSTNDFFLYTIEFKGVSCRSGQKRLHDFTPYHGDVRKKDGKEIQRFFVMNYGCEMYLEIEYDVYMGQYHVQDARIDDTRDGFIGREEAEFFSRQYGMMQTSGLITSIYNRDILMRNKQLHERLSEEEFTLTKPPSDFGGVKLEGARWGCSEVIPCL